MYVPFLYPIHLLFSDDGRFPRRKVTPDKGCILMELSLRSIVPNQVVTSRIEEMLDKLHKDKVTHGLITADTMLNLGSSARSSSSSSTRHSHPTFRATGRWKGMPPVVTNRASTSSVCTTGSRRRAFKWAWMDMAER
jgi:hypothetical protein